MRKIIIIYGQKWNTTPFLKQKSMLELPRRAEDHEN